MDPHIIQRSMPTRKKSLPSHLREFEVSMPTANDAAKEELEEKVMPQMGPSSSSSLTNHHYPRNKIVNLLNKEKGMAYNVIQRAIDKQLVATCLEEIDSLLASQWQPVFLNAQKNDPFRSQIKLSHQVVLEHYPVLARVVELVKQKLQTTYADYQFVDKISLLRSEPGGSRQEMHMDYQVSEEFDAHPPLSVLLALSEKARLNIEGFDSGARNSKSLGVGDVLVFHGYAWHAGCGYDKLNMRVHFYFVHKDVGGKRKKQFSESTYF